MATQTDRLFEELDYREADGIEVSLLWNRVVNSLSVFVVDARTNECFELEVSPEKALEAFHHPYAYAAFLGITVEGTNAERDESLIG
jgi:hypothetical protein